MTVLKVCGLRPGDDLSFVGEVATHVGFVFVPASRRYVRPDEAGDMVDQLGQRATAVGVFVNEELDSILEIADRSGIQVAQLHGLESPEFCQRLQAHGIKVWKALSIPHTDVALASVVDELAPFVGSVDSLLLDAAPPKNAQVSVTGGHGMTFNWTVLPQIEVRLQERVTGGRIPPLWIAGGLSPENVTTLLETYRPDGVDVSSGVEVMGRKSLQRIHAMIEAVNAYV